MFILYITCRYSHFNILFSSPCPKGNVGFWHPSYVDASYQVLVHLARQFHQRRFFRYRPIRNKNCLWWPCLLTDWVSSKTHKPNELKLSRKHIWKVLSKECIFCYDLLPNMALHRQFLFLHYISIS
jgi:hypothetical protein